MGVYSGPKVSKNNLSLALDAANTKNYNLTAIEYLIVGGGGSGGIGEANPAGDGAGGGGAGGVLTNVGGTPLSISSGQSYTIVVGNGGVNASGGNSSAFGLTAFGGGRGGNVRNASVTSGGSGGGAGGNCTLSNRTGGAGTAGQGNRGGNDLAPTADCSLRGGRGGGGAGSAATDAASAQGTSGGNGIVSYISGTRTYYAGGGGGGRGASNSVGGAGGLGGGGNGSNGTASPVAGTNNTGGGGGGGASYSSGVPAPGQGANGGSGIVIVRYPGPQKAIGGTVTFNKGYTIHTFTTVGSTTFTPLVATNNSAVLGLSDFSGNNRFATSVNGPTYSSANGGFLSFDGTDDYVSSGALSGSFASFTVIIWFYPTSVTNHENPIDCNYSYNGSTGNIGPRLEMNSSGALGWIYSNDTANNNNFYSHLVVSSGLAANTWHFAAITYSGGISTTYYNGNATGLSRSTIGSPTGFVGVMNNVTIGKGFHLGGAERIFTGRVSNTKIYNRALTAAEIRQNFNATRRRYGI